MDVPNNSVNTNVMAKYRRLKIQENLLLKTINNTLIDKNNRNHNSCSFINVNEIRNLYRDLKNQLYLYKLQKQSVKDLKLQAEQFQSEIKKLQQMISDELDRTKTLETNLLKQIGENPNLFETPCVVESNAKPFFAIVTSPVKQMISSPFQCSETQKLQEYLSMNGRYGGWSKYNHRIFVSSWQKYFKSNLSSVEEILNTTQYKRFKAEVMNQIEDVNCDDIMNHTNWYVQLLSLILLQKQAISTWKEKKEIIKRPQCATSNKSQYKSENLKHRPPIRRSENFEADLISRLTKEVTYRQFEWKDNKNIFGTSNNINTLPKLQSPSWRSCIKEAGV